MEINAIKPKRLFIYTKDVERLTGKGRKAASRLIRKIKAEIGKPQNKSLTVFEFCTHQNISVDQANNLL